MEIFKHLQETSFEGLSVSKHFHYITLLWCKEHVTTIIYLEIELYYIVWTFSRETE